MDVDQELLTQAALAKRWEVSPRTLERWRCRGTGPQYLKVGGRVLYRLTDIEAFEAAQLLATSAREDRPRRRCVWCGRERGQHGAPDPDPAAPRQRDRALRLGGAGRARRGPRVSPRLSRARPHRLRPLRRHAGARRAGPARQPRPRPRRTRPRPPRAASARARGLQLLRGRPAALRRARCPTSHPTSSPRRPRK